MRKGEEFGVSKVPDCCLTAQKAAGTEVMDKIFHICKDYGFGGNVYAFAWWVWFDLI